MREDEIEKKEKKKNVHIHARIHTDRQTHTSGWKLTDQNG